MRRNYIIWAMTVFGIIGTAYGASLLVYHFKHGDGLSVPSLILLIIAFPFLLVSLTLMIYSYIKEGKRKKNEPLPPIEEKIVEEKEMEPSIEEDPVTYDNHETIVDEEKEEYVPKRERIYESPSSHYVSTVYVKQVGYGPLLRIEDSRILDMRTSTHYRLEDNVVMQEGYGPVFEIRGNQIKSAFDGYLYELSGSNINKTFGGFYASISGNYITLFDGSIKYEMSDSLSKRQILIVAALLFNNN